MEKYSPLHIIKSMKYEDCIQRSVDYIDQHLMENLDLDKVARQSGYSLSHFYKVFPAITGFSLKEFARNKRLAYAARRLVHSRDRILDIALESGFESQEVFTRAFSALYGTTPRSYRLTRKGSLETFESMDEFARQMEQRGTRQPLQIPVQSEIIFRGWMHLVGMEIKTTIGGNIDDLLIPCFWQETFIPRLHEIQHRVMSNTAIAYEVQDPYSDGLLHMACVEVSDPHPPPGMTVRSLEPGFYAAFTPKRPLDPYEYSALVRYAYGEWFPMSGCEIRADYTLDLYIDQRSRDGKSSVQQMSVLIPINPPPKREMSAKALYPPHTR